MKALFEYITDSYSLLENPVEDWVLMSVVGLLAYVIAYGVVGKLYHGGIISGRDAGHFLHWIIRFFIFVFIYYVFAVLIRVYVWFNNLPSMKWWILGGGTIAIFLVCVIWKQVMLRKKEVYL